MQRVLLLLALATIFSCYHAQQYYPCNAMPVFGSLTLESAYLEVRNLSTMMYPRNNYTGEIVRTSWASLQLAALQEWDTPYPEDCREPGHYTTPGIIDGTSLSDTLFLPQDLLCSLAQVNDTLFGTVGTESVVMRMKHPSYPDFQATLNLTRPSSAHEIIYPGTNNTHYNDYRISYIPEHFKLTLQIDNWPWNKTTNNTHLVALMYGSASMNAPSSVYFGEAVNATTFRMTSNDPSLPLEFTQVLDRGFLLDGEPFMNNMTHASGTEPNVPANAEFGLYFAFGFCQFHPPGFHPETIYWDPQLSVLFNVAPPDTPATKKSNRTWLAILLGTLFGVLGLILIITLVFIFVPGAQKVFTPFRNTSTNRQAELAVKNRWKTTVKSDGPGAKTDEKEDVQEDNDTSDE